MGGVAGRRGLTAGQQVYRQRQDQRAGAESEQQPVVAAGLAEQPGIEIGRAAWNNAQAIVVRPQTSALRDRDRRAAARARGRGPAGRCRGKGAGDRTGDHEPRASRWSAPATRPRPPGQRRPRAARRRSRCGRPVHRPATARPWRRHRTPPSSRPRRSSPACRPRATKSTRNTMCGTRPAAFSPYSASSAHTATARDGPPRSAAAGGGRLGGRPAAPGQHGQHRARPRPVRTTSPPGRAAAATAPACRTPRCPRPTPVKINPATSPRRRGSTCGRMVGAASTMMTPPARPAAKRQAKNQGR